jgi:hypothetical protein
MAKVFLGIDEKYTVLNDSEIFGNIGSEEIGILGAATLTVHSTVERIEFPDAIGNYTFDVSGNVVTVAGDTNVEITVPDTNDQVWFFSDGRGFVHINALDDITINGFAIPTTPGPVDGVELAPADDAVGHTFTLQTISTKIPGTPDIPDYDVVYWGYNPHGHDGSGLTEDGTDNTGGPNDNDTLANEGPVDGGIPVADLVDFLVNITGLDFTELGLIDDDGVGGHPFDNVIDLSIGDIAVSNETEGGSDNTNTQELIITYADGTTLTTEAVLGEEYLDFLSDLLFDAEGNSRLYTVTVEGESGKSSRTKITPIVLTPTENNGGTVEEGYPNPGDDVIVAGRTELLHQAYINAGAGYNILEVDSKGVYAQPLALLNIQEIRIQNLPNVYSDGIQNSDSTYPDLNEATFELDQLRAVMWAALNNYDGSGEDEFVLSAYAQLNDFDSALFPEAPEMNPTEWIDDHSNIISANIDLATPAALEHSTIDLGRARSIERLVIVEDTENSDFAGVPLGELTVVGVRNNATLRLEGGFTEDVHIFYSEGLTGVLNIELALGGEVYSDIDILHNADVLNIDSQGVQNYMDYFFTGGEVSVMYISGTGAFGVAEDMYDSFWEDRPILIDARENTGGIDFHLSDVTDETLIYGTVARDEIIVETDGADDYNNFEHFSDITIHAGEGDNFVDADANEGNVTVTAGAGDDVIYAEADIDSYHGGNTIVDAGAGDNFIEAYAWSSSFYVHDSSPDTDGGNAWGNISVTTLEGSDIIYAEADEGDIFISAGDGKNWVEAYTDAEVEDAGDIDITTGSGDDSIWANAGGYGDVTVNAGDGDNYIESAYGYYSGDFYNELYIISGSGDDIIKFQGRTVDISSGAGDDEITVSGLDDDYVTEPTDGTGDPVDSHFDEQPKSDGAYIKIDTGPGSDTVTLGDYEYDTGSITAKEGSSITGEDITLFVNTESDLRAATLSGINRVILDDDDKSYTGQGDDGSYSNPDALLTIFDHQFTALGADIFSVQGSTFGADADLEIVVTEDTTLAELLNGQTLDKAINLYLVVNDDVTLELTAEELHTLVAVGGIRAGETSNGDLGRGKVLITDAGLTFDAYFSVNTLEGSLSIDFSKNYVTVHRTLDGYERPKPVPNTDSLWIDSDETPVVGAIGDTNTLLQNLYIRGEADLTFTGAMNLADNFKVDFSELTGSIDGLTLAEFEDIHTAMVPDNPATDPFDPIPAKWGKIVGNGGARVDIQVTNNQTVGEPGILDGGIHSSGVSTIMVTGINQQPLINRGKLQPQADSAAVTIFVCDSTEDLEYLGLQNNRYTHVTFNQVNWSTIILLEGDGYANASDQEKNLGDPDLSQIGEVCVNYYEPGANAKVEINNQGTELGLNEDAEDGLDPDGERWLDVKGINVYNADRLTINVSDGDANIQDVSGVDVESLHVNGVEDVTITVAEFHDGMYCSGGGLDTDDLSTIDASGVLGVFTLNLTGDYDFSDVDLIALDAIALGEKSPGVGVALTLNADQVVEDGADIVDNGKGTTLHVNGFGTQAIALSDIDVDMIGVVTFTDSGTEIVVDPTTDFGGAASVEIPATKSNTTVEMAAAQFETISGTMGNTDAPVVTSTEGGGYKAKLVLTSLANDETLDMANIEAGTDVTVRFNDVVATSKFKIEGFATAADTYTYEFTGTNDLSKGTLPAGIIDSVSLAEGAYVKMTAAQVAAIGIVDANMDGIADNWSGLAGATLEITGVSDMFALDLNLLQKAGIDIGNLTLTDSNATITFAAAATLGGADSIVTPTADGNDTVDGLEPTKLVLNHLQFDQMEGTGTITGDSVVDITGLTNNNGIDKVAVIDVTGITARHGTVTLGVTAVTLAGGATPSSLGDFTIQLADGQMILFSTPEQADGADIVEMAPGSDTTSVVWLFDSLGALTEIDTSEYSSTIERLFIKEILVDGQNEESLWSVLSGNIEVVKYDSVADDILRGFYRINTFEAMTALQDGVTFDDLAEYWYVQMLTINLEGNTNIGNVVIDNTVGDGTFQALTINSYENRTTLTDGQGVNIPVDDGFTFQPNIVGDISLSATPSNDLVDVTLNTGPVNDGIPTTGLMAPFEGLALETGTIFFAAESGQDAKLTLTGANNIKIGGVDIGDAEVSLLTINALGHMGAPDPSLKIGGVNNGAELKGLRPHGSGSRHLRHCRH